MIVGIDIGTSYSSISMLGPDNKPVSVDISTGASLFGSKCSLPSAVYQEDDGEILVGQAAMNSRIRKPQNFRMEFKRNLGDNYPLMIGNRSFHVEELYTELLRHMKSCTQKLSDEKIEYAYLTYPASYGKDTQDRLLSAAKAAGLFRVKLVPEPIAAAMSYYAAGYIKDGQTLLVYDFGGGTFDCAILKFENGNFCVLGDGGLERCGGIDMDRLIYQDMIKTVDTDTMQMLQKNQTMLLRFTGQLSELAVKVKHQLSSAQIVRENIPMGWDNIAYSLDRERFNRMIVPMISDTIQVCRNVLGKAHIAVSDLSAALMVGGTSRVPLVQDMVRQFLKNVPVHIAPDLELAVVNGSIQQCRVPEDPEELYQKSDEYDNRGDRKTAFELLLRAAQRGHARAQCEVGYRYLNGIGIQQNIEEAIRWSENAAAKDVPAAMYNLGLLYSPGIIGPVDEFQAVKWFLKAERLHYEAAGKQIGYVYDSLYSENGEKMLYMAQKLMDCGERNEAIVAYTRSADEGNTEARFQIAELCRLGQHPSFSPAEQQTAALRMYRLAAKHGHKESKERLDRHNMAIVLEVLSKHCLLNAPLNGVVTGKVPTNVPGDLFFVAWGCTISPAASIYSIYLAITSQGITVGARDEVKHISYDMFAAQEMPINFGRMFFPGFRLDKLEFCIYNLHEVLRSTREYRGDRF